MARVFRDVGGIREGTSFAAGLGDRQSGRHSHFTRHQRCDAATSRLRSASAGLGCSPLADSYAACASHRRQKNSSKLSERGTSRVWWRAKYHS